MQPGTVGSSSFTATNGVVGSVVPINPSGDSAAQYSVSVTPTQGLASGSVSLSLTAAVRDMAGNRALPASLAGLGSQLIDTLEPTLGEIAPTVV